MKSTLSIACLLALVGVSLAGLLAAPIYHGGYSSGIVHHFDNQKALPYGGLYGHGYGLYGGYGHGYGLYGGYGYGHGLYGYGHGLYGAGHGLYGAYGVAPKLGLLGGFGYGHGKLLY